MAQCKSCQEDATNGNFCLYHYQKYWRDRWDKKNGEEALKRFLFECFPDRFERQWGYPDQLKDAIHMIYEMCMNGKSVDYNLGALFVWRGGGKTTFIKGAVCWVIVQNIWDNIMYRGVTVEKVREDFFDDLKIMLQSEILVKVYGEMLVDATKKSNKGKSRSKIISCLNEINTRVSIKGAEQSARGTLGKKRIGWGIGDDIESIDNTKTEDARKNLIKKIWMEDIPAHRADRSMYTYISTPHPDGIYFEVKKHKNFQRVEHWLYRQDKDGRWLKDSEGNRLPTWPELFPLATCILKEQNYLQNPDLGRKMFNQEYLGILSSDDERRIPEHLIQFREYKISRAYGHTWAEIESENRSPIFPHYYSNVFTVMALDPGASLDPTACDSAGIVIDAMPNYNVMVRDAWFGKYRVRDILKSTGTAKYDEFEIDAYNIEREGIVGKMYRKIIEHHPNLVVVEVVGAFEGLYQEMEMLKNKFFAKKFPDHFFQMIKYNPITDDRVKVDRISQILQSIFETRNGYIGGQFIPVYDSAGNVISFKKPQEELIEQMINLGSMKLKDLADVFATAREHVRWPTKIEYVKALQQYNRPEEEDDDEPVGSLAQAFRERAWA